VSYAKNELIEMPFGIWFRVGPRKHVVDGVHTGTTWRIRRNRSCAAAMRPFVKLLWPLHFPIATKFWTMKHVDPLNSSLLTRSEEIEF